MTWNRADESGIRRKPNTHKRDSTNPTETSSLMIDPPHAFFRTGRTAGMISVENAAHFPMS